MKRLQIYIDEDVDEALAVMAAEEGTSKAALIRRFVADRVRLGRRSREPDPLDEIVGWADIDPAPVDDVVYGPR